MSKTVTQWFEGVNPEHVGVYENEPDKLGRSFTHWNGSFWGVASLSVKGAYIWGHYKRIRQDCLWRGLADKPAEVQS